MNPHKVVINLQIATLKLKNQQQNKAPDVKSKVKQTLYTKTNIIIPALHDVGGSFCRSLSSFKIRFDAISLNLRFNSPDLHQIIIIIIIKTHNQSQTKEIEIVIVNVPDKQNGRSSFLEMRYVWSRERETKNEKLKN